MPKKIPAATAPVARVLPLLTVAHLDRGFDYLVAEDDSAAAQPGVKVRIRFNGKLQDAIVLERLGRSDFSGDLRFIDRVISPYVVYPPAIAQLIESLANRYGGTRPDIIRSAIPPRHARAEESDLDAAWESFGEVREPDLSGWEDYIFGRSFVDAVLAGTTSRAAWQLPSGDSWLGALAALATKVALDGGGVLLVVPDQKTVDLLESHLREHLAAKQVAVLTNSLGPQARYRRYLSALTGQARIVLGTRSAAFAPVQNLRLAVVLDDGDDSLVDNKKPYVHAREVLTTRSAVEGCSLIIGGVARTAETQYLVESGWVHDLLPAESTLAGTVPRVVAVGPYGLSLGRDVSGGDPSSIAGSAFQAMRAALDRGEAVLVQSPRKGYIPVLACGNCHAAARCRHCNGPLGLPTSEGGRNEASAPTCRWCGRIALRFRCADCGGSRLRAIVLGSDRTAEELGKVFPSTRVVVSGGNRIVEELDDKPALVIATPGAEPRISGGAYGAVVLADTGALLNRQDLRATEEALATWGRAAALCRPADNGGAVIVVADPELEPVGFLTRWAFADAAAAELAARRQVGFPPAVHMAAVDGPDAGLDAFSSLVELPANAEILGPVPLGQADPLPGEYDAQRFGPPQRLLVRTPPGPRSELGRALRRANAQRSARKNDLPMRIQVDPIHVG